MKTNFPAVRVNACGYHVCVPDWRWDGRRRPFPDYDLWVVFAGRGWLELAGARHILRPGTAVLFRPGDRHLATHDPASALLVRSAHVDFLTERGKVWHPGEEVTGPRLLTLRNREFVAELMDRMLTAFHDDHDPAAAGFWAAAALRERVAAETAARLPPGLTRAQAEEIDAICRAMRAHPERPWRVAELAQRLHCTPDHFTRCFRAAKGCAPREFLLQARMECARLHLRESSLSVSQIAALLGYCDVYLFSRQFRRACGRSPAQYRHSS